MYDELTPSSLVKQNIFGYMQSLFGFVSNFFLAVILPIVMGAYLFGVFSLAAGIIYLVAGLFSAGFNYSAIRFTSSNWVQKKFQQVKATLVYLMKLEFIVAALSSIALFLCADLIASFYNIPNFSFLIKLTSPLIVLYAFVNLMGAAFVGMQRSQYSFLGNAVNSILLIVLPLALFLAAGLEGALIGLVVSFLVALFFMIALLSRMLRVRAKKTAINRKEIKSNILMFSLISLFNLFLFMALTVMLGLFVPPQEVGYFKISLSWFAAIGVMVPISTQIFFSSIVGLKKGADKAKSERYLFNVLRYSSIVIMPMMFGLFFFGRNLIELVYGAEFILAGISLQLLSWSLFFQFTSNLFYGVLTAYDRLRELTSRFVWSTVLGFVFSVAAMAYLGLTGAGIGFFFTSALLFFALYLPIQKLTKVSVARIAMRPLMASVIMSLLIVYARPLVSTLYEGIALVLLSALFYFAILFLIRGISKEDLKIVRLIRQ